MAVRIGKIKPFFPPCHHSTAEPSGGGGAAAPADAHRDKSWDSTALLPH